jgi:zinc/manganese transport system permease protein
MLLPAAAARCWGLGAAGMMALASGIGFVASLAGLLASYHANLPSGPAIILAAGALFAISLAASGAWARLAPLFGRGET